jgi:Ig-like domain CHU_C associated
MGSSVTFVSKHPHPEVSCMWYESMEDILPSHSGFSFTTAPLSKSATYFASAEDANGCESERIPVGAKVISYDSVTIALKESVLISSYTEGNQWFYQGEMLPGETNQVFTADEPGLYMVTVTVGSCTTQATINYVITGSDVEDVAKNIQVFPNPFGGRFFIRFRSEISVELFSVLSSNGTPVNYICSAGPDHESWEINTAHWPSGLYMLCFKIADDHSYIRIVKR